MQFDHKIYTKISLLILLLGLGAPGCIDLEEDISSVLSLDDLQGEADILAALAPIYRTYGEVVRVPHEQQIMAYGADDITTWWAGNKAPLRVFDRFDFGNGENSDIRWLDDPWNGYWKTIYYANNLIKGLKTSVADASIISVADAEARFLRALSYFNLVRGYGNMPIILEEDQPTGEEVRATVMENYLVIEADLQVAEDNLPAPDQVDQIGRASSAAAKAILLDLYMTWAGWPIKDQSKYQLAASKAKEIMDMNHFALSPITELWTLENQNSRESVFAMQFSAVEDFRNTFPADHSFHEARGWSDMYPERQFFLDFPEGPRKDYTFHSEIPQRKIVAGKIVSKDPPTIPWRESQRNHPMYRKFTEGEDLTVNNRTTGYRAMEVVRYAEILLNFAEATSRVNGGMATPEALEALNQVKRRAAGLDYLTPDATVDATSATPKEIVQEKAWEHAGEFKRWWDLVRLEMVAEVTATRDPEEEVPLAIDPSEINWKHYIAPIPFKAISTSDLVQNPEGFKIQ